MPDAAANNGPNQRVTNALLRYDIQHLTSVVEGGFSELKARDADHETRIRDNEKGVAQNRARLDNVTKVFGMIQIGFAAVVAWLQVRA